MRTDATTPAEQALLLKPRDAAKALQISERMLWKITSPRGDLRAVRIGAAVRYDPADLRSWIESQKHAEVSA